MEARLTTMFTLIEQVSNHLLVASRFPIANPFHKVHLSAAQGCFSATRSLATCSSSVVGMQHMKNYQRVCCRLTEVASLVRALTRNAADETLVRSGRMRTVRVIQRLACSIDPCRSFAKIARHLIQIRVGAAGLQRVVRTEASGALCIPRLRLRVGSGRQLSAVRRRKSL